MKYFITFFISVSCVFFAFGQDSSVYKYPHAGIVCYSYRKANYTPPLLIFEGKKISYAKLNRKFKNISSEELNKYEVKVIKGDSAIALYGDKGKHGVLIVDKKPTITN